jgi:hypothetical protein
MVFLRGVLSTYVEASEQHPGWNMGGGDVDDSFKFLISGAQMCGRWAVNYRVRAGLMINLVGLTMSCGLLEKPVLIFGNGGIDVPPLLSNGQQNIRGHDIHQRRDNTPHVCYLRGNPAR